jgi:hypothetical protein
MRSSPHLAREERGLYHIPPFERGEGVRGIIPSPLLSREEYGPDHLLISRERGGGGLVSSFDRVEKIIAFPSPFEKREGMTSSPSPFKKGEGMVSSPYHFERGEGVR